MDAFLRRCVMLPPLDMSFHPGLKTSDNKDVHVKHCCQKSSALQTEEQTLTVSMPQYRNMVWIITALAMVLGPRQHLFGQETTYYGRTGAEEHQVFHWWVEDDLLGWLFKRNRLLLKLMTSSCLWLKVSFESRTTSGEASFFFFVSVWLASWTSTTSFLTYILS